MDGFQGDYEFYAHVARLHETRERERVNKRRLKWLGGTCIVFLIAAGLYALQARNTGSTGASGSVPDASSGDPAGDWGAVHRQLARRLLCGATAVLDAGAWQHLLSASTHVSAGSSTGEDSSHVSGSSSSGSSDCDGAKLADRWSSALQQVLPPEQMAWLSEQTEPHAPPEQRRQGGKAAKRAAAGAAEVQHRLACKLPLLQLAAGFAAQWAERVDPGAAGTGRADSTVAAVASAAQQAHRALLAVHAALHSHMQSGSTVTARRLAVLLAAEQTADAGAAALGWQWQNAAGVTAEAKQQLGARLWQPAAGQQLCADEWGLLRLLYTLGEGGSSNGSVAQPAGVAELLESGQLGAWVDHIAGAGAGPYNESSGADVALAAGQLAVLERGELAWALPTYPSPQPLAPWWSPPFALGGTRWRLVLVSNGLCLHLAAMPDRPLPQAVRLRVHTAAVTALTAATIDHMSPFHYENLGVPPFNLWWVGPTSVEEETGAGAAFDWPGGPGPTTLSFAGGEHSHRALPGCWLSTLAGGSQADTGTEAAPPAEVLVVVRMHQPSAAAAPEAAVPAVPAQLFPVPTAGNGSAALAVENRYWQLMSRQEQQRWRVPPGAPAFASWQLQQGSLPALVAAVLEAAGSRIKVGDGWLGASALLAVHAEAQVPAPLDEAAARAVRMARQSSTADAAADGRSLFKRSRDLLSLPVGDFIETPVHWLARAARSQLARRAAGAGLLLFLLHQLLIGLGLARSALQRIHLARCAAAAAGAGDGSDPGLQRAASGGSRQPSGPGRTATAPLDGLTLEPSLLSWLRQLPQAVVQRAHAMAALASSWDVSAVANWMLCLSAAYDFPILHAHLFFVELHLAETPDVGITCARIGSLVVVLEMDAAFGDPLADWLTGAAYIGWLAVLLRPHIRRLLLLTLASVHTAVLAHDAGYPYPPATLFPTIREIMGSPARHKGGSRQDRALLWWSFQAAGVTAITLKWLVAASCALNPACRAAFGCSSLLCMLRRAGVRTALACATALVAWGGWVAQAHWLLSRLRAERLSRREEEEEEEEWREQIGKYAGGFWPACVANILLTRLCGLVEPRQLAAASAPVASTPWHAEVLAAWRVHSLPLHALQAAWTHEAWYWSPAKRWLSLWASMWYRGFACCKLCALYVTVFTCAVTGPGAALLAVGRLLLAAPRLLSRTLWAAAASARTLATATPIDWLPRQPQERERREQSAVSAALVRLSEWIEQAPGAASRLLWAAVEAVGGLLMPGPRHRQQQQQQQRAGGSQARRHRQSGRGAGGATGPGVARFGPARPGSAGSRQGGSPAEAGSERSGGAGASGNRWWGFLLGRQTAMGQGQSQGLPAEAAAAGAAVQAVHVPARRPPSVQHEQPAAGPGTGSSDQAEQPQVEAAAQAAAAAPAGSKKQQRSKQRRREASGELAGAQQGQQGQRAGSSRPASASGGRQQQQQQQGQQREAGDDEWQTTNTHRRPAQPSQPSGGQAPKAPPLPPQPAGQLPPAAPVQYWQPTEALRAPLPSVAPPPAPQLPSVAPQPATPAAAAASTQPAGGPDAHLRQAGLPPPSGAAAMHPRAAAQAPLLPILPGAAAMAEPPAWDAEAAAAAVQLSQGSRAGQHDDSDDTLCIVCLDAPRQTTLAPCGHRVMCLACLQRLRSASRPCPICDAPIESYILREFMI